MLPGPQGKPQFKNAVVQMLRIRRAAQFIMRGQSFGPGQNLCLIRDRQFFQTVQKRAASVFQPDTAKRLGGNLLMLQISPQPSG